MGGLEGATQTFLNSGILGAIIVILGAVIVYLYRSREKIQDERLQEAKEVRQQIAEPLSQLSGLVKQSNDEILDAIYDSKRPKRSR
jgi:chromosome condensin MukBEF MukE localization factor